MNSMFRLAVLPCLLVGASVALAQSTAPITDPLDKSRYVIVEKEGGFVRLNRRTGQTSYCKVTQGNLICRMSADERAAYEAEIAELNQRIDRLETQMSQITEGKSPGQGKEKSKQRTQDDIRLDEEFDKAMDFAQDAMKRFFDVVKELKNKYEDSQ